MIFEIGPPAVEPVGHMREFMKRDEHPALMSYWWDTHMSRWRWQWLRNRMKEIWNETNEPVQVYVDGLGTIAGYIGIRKNKNNNELLWSQSTGFRRNPFK